MRPTFLLLAAAGLLTLTPYAHAAAEQSAETAQPEIQRGLGHPQAIGQLHTLRTIPEACVRLQGEFTGDAAAPYRFESVPRDRCARRARYIDATALKAAPSVASGWILNDVIRVPNATCPEQQAALSVWRHPVAPPSIVLDGQGRMRMYLKDGTISAPSGQKENALSLYTATLEVSGGCG